MPGETDRRTLSEKTAEDEKVKEKKSLENKPKVGILPVLDDNESKDHIRERFLAFSNVLRFLKCKHGETLPESSITLHMALEISLRGRERFMTEGPVIRTSGGICVFGDIHGQFFDLSDMLDKTGVPPSQRLLFLGDYVDRGAYGIEVVCLLTIYKFLYPKHIHLLRGNHETRAVNKQYGFLDECKRKFGEKNGRVVWTHFLNMFNVMPIAGIVGEKIFCCHGGISESLYEMRQLGNIVRPYDIADIGVLCDLIWADPSSLTPRYSPSPRGISKIFGEEALKEFCEIMNIDLVIRAHQCVTEGTELSMGKLCLTVFSVPSYCLEENKAGILHIDCNLNVRCYQHKSDCQ